MALRHLLDSNLDARPQRMEQQALAQWLQVPGQDIVGKTHGFSWFLAPDLRSTIRKIQDYLLKHLTLGP